MVSDRRRGASALCPGRGVAALTLVLVLGASARASAQQPSPDEGAPVESTDDRVIARNLAADADQKLEAGDIKGALELFQRADAIFPAPTLKLAAAHAMVRLGQLIEAHELLLAIGRGELPRTAPPPWHAARETARQEATALNPRIPRVTLHLDGPTGGALAAVLVDGRRIPLESLDLARPINPGPHRLRAEAAGHVATEQTIQMAEGESLRLTLRLVPTPAAARPAASASSSALVGPRPVRPDGETPSLSPTLMWVGFSVGGAALISGAITGLMSSSRTSDIKDQCTGNACPASLSGDADSARTLATVSNVSFALAAVGAGVGLYGLLTTPDAPATPPATALRWRLDLGPGAAFVRGSF